MEIVHNPLVAESVFTIEPLEPSHVRAAFVCKEAALTDYLVGHKALRDQKNGHAKVFCFVDENKRVMAYYTLSIGGIFRDSVARALYGPLWKENRSDKFKIFEKFPYDSIGVIIIGRLAIDQSLAGKHFGSVVLGHALTSAVEMSKLVPAQAVYLDAKNPKVASIYAEVGFRPLPDNPLSMYLLMETLRQGSDAANSAV